MDLFDDKALKPMLIGESGKPFDSEDYIFELKLDGERCLAFLDPDAGTELRNKRNDRMLAKFPELSELHKQMRTRCIVDGELMVALAGMPSFAEVQRRSLMSNRFKIELAAKQFPATFVAFDILYYDGQDVTKKPLMERKALLEQNTKQETERLALSRYVSGKGTVFFDLAKQKGLEGIVAKRRDSLYYLGKRTGDWVKIKNLLDEDFVVCGYILKEPPVISLVLGQYDQNGGLVYQGHVTLGVSSEAFQVISQVEQQPGPPFAEPIPASNDEAVWLVPELVCTVKYMMRTTSGGLRQPVFKGLRQDKPAAECQVMVP